MSAEAEVLQRVLEGNGLTVGVVLLAAWRTLRRLDRIETDVRDHGSRIARLEDKPTTGPHPAVAE